MHNHVVDPWSMVLVVYIFRLCVRWCALASRLLAWNVLMSLSIYCAVTVIVSIMRFSYVRHYSLCNMLIYLTNSVMGEALTVSDGVDSH